MGIGSSIAGAPEWVHLLPAGEVRTNDGRGPYRTGDLAALAAHSMKSAGGKLVLDENHSTDLAAPHGRSAPARAWIVELQQRGDGVWGRVRWTPSGRQLVEAGEYRGISPVIAHRKDGTVTAILRASLTNTPNLSGLTSLHSAIDDHREDSRKRVMAALGFSNVSESVVMTAVRAILSLREDNDHRRTVRARLIDALGLGSVKDEMIAAKVRQVLAPMHRSFDEYLAEEKSLHSQQRDGWFDIPPEIDGAVAPYASTMGDAQRLAHKAAIYRGEMAAKGVTIDLPEAVRAVVAADVMRPNRRAS